MKNKFLSVLLVSILACQSSYAIDESINNAPYHADSMSCFLEQTTTIDGSASMLRDYGIDNNGKHKYEVSFSGGKSNGFYFNVIGKIDGNAKRCNDLVATNDFVPSKVSGASGAVLWKLTSTAKRGCYPEYYDVVDADSNVKKFDSTPMPEIQVQLDPSSSADGIKKLIITSAFSKSIKVTGFSNSKGKKEESVVFEGPATIDAGNPSVSVDLNTLLCKPEKGNYGGSYRFNIDYKVDGMEKTTQIVISYSCNSDLNKKNEEIASLTHSLTATAAELVDAHKAGNATVIKLTNAYIAGNATATELADAYKVSNAAAIELADAHKAGNATVIKLTNAYIAGNATATELANVYIASNATATELADAYKASNATAINAQQSGNICCNQLSKCDTAITLARSSDGLNNHGECSTCFEKIDYDLNWNVTV